MSQGSRYIETVESIANSAQNRARKNDRIIEKICHDIQNNFPQESFEGRYVGALLSFFLQRSIELIILGQYPSFVLEIHASLERFSVDRAKELICKDRFKKIADDLFGRKTLTTVSEYFKQMGIWDKKDINDIKRLSRIRNGIAHHNFDKLSKVLSKKINYPVHTEEIGVDEDTAVEALILFLRLLVKYNFTLRQLDIDMNVKPRKK